ncbi:MAG: hypothetical protein AB2421_11250, partial [Thermotaleaceae bacterium]
MDRNNLMKLLLFEKDEILSKAHDSSCPIQDQIRMDKKLKKIIQELQLEKLVDYQDQKYQLTNIS